MEPKAPGRLAQQTAIKLTRLQMKIPNMNLSTNNNVKLMVIQTFITLISVTFRSKTLVINCLLERSVGPHLFSLINVAKFVWQSHAI